MNRKLLHPNGHAFGKPTIKGKFIYYGDEKMYIKGVTYGTFAPDSSGTLFPGTDTLKKDFYLMAQHGINCIRTYTVPPIDLLDIAHSMNLKVMVGLPWEQHITFLDKKTTRDDIVRRVKEGVVQCNYHPAILCYTIGNEIPAPMVRWYGKKKIEGFLKRLYNAVKQIDKLALVTYVNYPTTEYLDLSFLDFDCFNVYLETPQKLSSYISRLHNLSGDRPLVLAEIGLDSYRNGTQKQAEVLTWQIETVFAKGCAGIFVFAWTDEWWRGGSEIEDWDFGLVDRQRNSKPALFAVSNAMKNVPLHFDKSLPKITVIVCSYNGSATIRECIEGILKLDYPHFDVVVVNDGSKDNLAEIVREYPVKLISTENRGLSNARNTGMYSATGEIIAYIDDDAYPDPHWLHYLAFAYINSDHACIGGPNIAPYDEKFISTCVANAPGGPVHVLETDEIAEHVPGCNMTFRKDALMKIGGFDPVFRSAGDDVDVCWRIQQSGRTIGFHPSAVVWHHRRNSFKAYWNQQKGYGKAEALLEAKWPEKYNSLGHLTWAGRIYGNGFTLPIKTKKEKIFHGTWGSALFQSVYQPQGNYINSIPLMPEWYLITALLGVLGSFGFLWSPLFWLLPLFAISIAIIVTQAVISARKNSSLPPLQKKKYKYILFIILLHIVQPVARLYGRLSNGLTPWRNRGADAHSKFLFGFYSRIFTHWTEEWQSAEDWLLLIEKNLLFLKTRIQRGDPFDRWDLQVQNGLFIRNRGLLTIEEHGSGKQYLRFKCTPYLTLRGFIIPSFLIILAIITISLKQYVVAGFAISLLLLISLRFIREMARSMHSLYLAFKMLDESEAMEMLAVIQKENIPAKRMKKRLSRFQFQNKTKNLDKKIEVEMESIEENSD